MQMQFITRLLDSKHICVKLLEMKSDTTFQQTMNMALALKAAKKRNIRSNASNNVNRISRSEKKNWNNRPQNRNNSDFRINSHELSLE